MNEINIIYNWKNKEVRTIFNEEEKILILKALHSKSTGVSGVDYRLLEEKSLFGMLGSNHRYISDNDDIEELKQILKMGIDLNYKFRIDITFD